jgi:hypothetical protein
MTDNMCTEAPERQSHNETFTRTDHKVKHLERRTAYIFKGWKGKVDSEAPGRMIHSVEHLRNNELDPEALGKTSREALGLTIP